MHDAVRGAAIRHRNREPPAHAEPALSFTQQQQAASEDWLPPLKSTVSFLRRTAGRSKGSDVSVFLMAVARRRLSEPLRYSVRRLNDPRLGGSNFAALAIHFQKMHLMTHVLPFDRRVCGYDGKKGWRALNAEGAP
jgi:hypothetical protein